MHSLDHKKSLSDKVARMCSTYAVCNNALNVMKYFYKYFREKSCIPFKMYTQTSYNTVRW